MRISMTQRQTAADRLAAMRAAKQQPAGLERPTGLYINGVPVPRSVQAEGTAAVLEWAQKHAPARSKPTPDVAEAAADVAEEQEPAAARGGKRTRGA